MKYGAAKYGAGWVYGTLEFVARCVLGVIKFAAQGLRTDKPFSVEVETIRNVNMKIDYGHGE